MTKLIGVSLNKIEEKTWKKAEEQSINFVVNTDNIIIDVVSDYDNDYYCKDDNYYGQTIDDFGTDNYNGHFIYTA